MRRQNDELDELTHTDLLRHLSCQWVCSGWKEWKENRGATGLESLRAVILLVTDGLGWNMKLPGSVPPKITAAQEQSESKKFNEFPLKFQRI
jgi:hypothetical protein